MSNLRDIDVKAEMSEGVFWTDEDRAVLQRVEQSLADGLTLKQWWEQKNATNSYAESFEIIREFNPSDDSFSFFDSVQFPNRVLPVMGTVDESLYDNVKQSSIESVRDEFREFVLRYFMRVSDYKEPQAYTEERGRPRTKYMAGLSWCPQVMDSERGFGFSQHYYKLRETGEIGKFRHHESASIVDLREIGTKYEWIVLKVRIFNFNLSLRLLGSEQAQLVIPLIEESYLVVSRDFVFDEAAPAPDVVGRYGFGYAFIRSPDTGFLAYGPGEFNAAIEMIRFSLHTDGTIRAGLVFVVNRPEKILNVMIDPVDWSFQIADFFSLGMTKTIFGPMRNLFRQMPLRVGGIDPMSIYVTVTNGLTGGAAGQELCISREQLEKTFLVQHYMQHYQMLVGSLLTWRRIPNWLDEASLPIWAIKGQMA